MQSHELLREVFRECSPKQVAAELGLSLSMIYKWAEPGDPAAGSGSTNPLDRVDALIRCTNDPRLVQWISQRAGGSFGSKRVCDSETPWYPLVGSPSHGCGPVLQVALVSTGVRESTIATRSPCRASKFQMSSEWPLQGAC